MNRVKSDTIARTVILFLSLMNQMLAICGKETLPFVEDDFYQMASLLATFFSAVNAWWKNNSFTKAAIQADTYKDELKKKEANR